MIVCNRCGTHNTEDATFCQQCGAFLEWEGTRLQTEVPEPEPNLELEVEDPADLQRRGIVRRVRDAVRGEGDGQSGGAVGGGPPVAGEAAVPPSSSGSDETTPAAPVPDETTAAAVGPAPLPAPGLGAPVGGGPGSPGSPGSGSSAPGSSAPGSPTPGSSAPGSAAPASSAPGWAAAGWGAPDSSAPGWAAPGSASAAAVARDPSGSPPADALSAPAATPAEVDLRGPPSVGPPSVGAAAGLGLGAGLAEATERDPGVADPGVDPTRSGPDADGLVPGDGGSSSNGASVDQQDSEDGEAGQAAASPLGAPGPEENRSSAGGPSGGTEAGDGAELGGPPQQPTGPEWAVTPPAGVPLVSVAARMAAPTAPATSAPVTEQLPATETQTPPAASPAATAPRRPAARAAASSMAVPTIAARVPEPDEEADTTPGDLGADGPSARLPTTQQPAAVKPSFVTERPRATPAHQEEIPVARPGDIICGRCAYPNAPTRQYCRRCGLVLQVVVEVHVRWWRRWWRRFVAWWRRNRNEYPEDLVEEDEEEPVEAGAAGASGGAAAGLVKGKGALTKGKGKLKKPKELKGLKQPKGFKGGSRRPGAPGLPHQGGAPSAIMPMLTKVLPALLMLGLVAYLVSGTVRHNLGRTVSRVGTDIRVLVAPHYALQKPTGVTASSYAPQEPPGNAFDEIVGSPWVTAPADGEGAGQSISATFPAATTINQVIFTLGTGVQATYETEARMHQVRVTLYGDHGTALRSQVFTLNDTGKPQNVAINANHVQKATVMILSVYPSLYQASQRTGCATDEIEFFKKD